MLSTQHTPLCDVQDQEVPTARPGTLLPVTMRGSQIMTTLGVATRTAVSLAIRNGMVSSIFPILPRQPGDPAQVQPPGPMRLLAAASDVMHASPIRIPNT